MIRLLSHSGNVIEILDNCHRAIVTMVHRAQRRATCVWPRATEGRTTRTRLSHVLTRPVAGQDVQGHARIGAGLFPIGKYRFIFDSHKLFYRRSQGIVGALPALQDENSRQCCYVCGHNSSCYRDLWIKNTRICHCQTKELTIFFLGMGHLVCLV